MFVITNRRRRIMILQMHWECLFHYNPRFLLSCSCNSFTTQPLNEVSRTSISPSSSLIQNREVLWFNLHRHLSYSAGQTNIKHNPTLVHQGKEGWLLSPVFLGGNNYMYFFLLMHGMLFHPWVPKDLHVMHGYLFIQLGRERHCENKQIQCTCKCKYSCKCTHDCVLLETNTLF